MPNYGDPNYWEERYKNNEDSTFDWLEDYETLKPIIEEFKLDKLSSRVLILGCGNAEFSENMHDDGYKIIFNIDISKNAITNMQKRNEFRQGMKWEVMDVRDLKYEDGFFDIAIDKSTIDALLCGEHSFLNVAKMTKEVQRVLKQGGIYMVISYGQPENRIFHLEREHLAFDLSVYTIKKDYTGDVSQANRIEKIHYVYICKKKEGADIISKQFYSSIIYDLECQEKLEDEENEKEDKENESSDNEESDNDNPDFLSNNNVDDNL